MSGTAAAQKTEPLYVPPKTEQQRSLRDLLDAFATIFERIRSDYVEKLDDMKVVENAIAGMLKAAGAPASDMEVKSYCGSPPEMKAKKDDPASQAVKCFADAFEKIRKQYAGKVADEALVSGAAEEMTKRLDPHSTYMNGKQFRQLQIQVREETGGIGVEIAAVQGAARIEAPLEGTPAAEAGLRAGDLITDIDNKSLEGRSLTDVVVLLQGPVGSTIRIKIKRKGTDQPIEYMLKRAVIRAQPVRARMEGDDVIYVRLAKFNAETTSQLTKAIRETSNRVPSDKLKGYVIDLRGNPGGLLNEAISVSDIFLDKGDILSVKARSPEDSRSHKAKPGDLTNGQPIIVLINGASASASEIVAGALQDNKRATIIGTRSFGMGTMQTIIPLGTSNGAMRLTTARFYRPSGRPIQLTGIAPDITVPQDMPPDFDAEIKSEASLPGHLKIDGEEKAGSQSYMPPDAKDDKALRMALDLLRGSVANPSFPPDPKAALPN